MSRASLLPVHALRVLALTSATVLAAVLLLATPATAAPAVDVGAIILAVEGEPLGPDPMPRTAEDNPARELAGYEDLETPFTWGAAWLLTFLALGGLATMGLVYYRAVERPGRSDTKAGARR
jgi:hypothetical protein